MRTPMHVRPADPSEIDLLAGIWYHGWQDAHAGILPPDLARRRTLDSFRERLRAALPDVLVVGPALPVGLRAAKFYEKRGWHRAGTVMHEPDDSGGIVFEVWRYEKRLWAGPGADRH